MNAIDIDDDYLEHYGVMGMKWGVRKDRERVGTRAKKTVSKAVAGSVKAGGRAVRFGQRKIKSSIQTHKENKKQAKQLGYKKVSDYKKARISALYSHDPAVVARGMKTLTDKELANKVKRLSEEKKIINLVPPKTKSVGAEALQNFARTAAVTAGKNVGTKIGDLLTSSKSGADTKEDSQKSTNKTSNKKSSTYKMSSFSNVKTSSVSKAEKTKGKTALDYYKNSPIKLLPANNLEVDVSEFQNDKERK